MALQVRRAAWLKPDWWRRHPNWAVTLLLSGAVAAFSTLWVRGNVLLDGRGIALYARLSSTYLSQLDRIPYWLPEMWAGSPVWALGPSLPLFLLVPFTTIMGGDTAVKVAILVLQVVGGVGAYVLARSLWGRGPGAVVAGLVYSLHPMVISHGALAGLEGLLGVTAATPWLAWTFRRALRGDGTRFVVASGLIAAAAVLHQAEHALALPMLCAVMLVVELVRPKDHAEDNRRRPMLVRAGAVVLVGLAGIAYWLLPLAALRESFALSPPELVEAELTGGAAAQIANEIGVFFDRPTPLSGAVGYYRTGLFPQFFYVGMICAALTLVTLVLLARRRPERVGDSGHGGDHGGEAHLVGILFASALAMWFSTGIVPLIGSGPALRQQVVPLAVTGLGAGLLVGCLLRHLRLGRFAVLGLLAAAALLVAMPFTTPYETLQKVVPLFALIRFPRFYTLAALGFSLGAAYPVAVLERRLRHRGDLPRWAPLAAALGVAALFLVDIAPYRALYDVGPPASAAAYRQASQSLPAPTGLFRVATGQLEPGAAAALINNGWLLSTGWPHPVAGRHLWPITGETYAGPPGYREAAFGLSATAYLAVERWQGLGTATEVVTDVHFVRNARALPMLRAYEQVVVVDDPELTPFLATGLAYRNVGVISPRRSLGSLLDGMPTVAIPSADLCDRPSLADLNAVAGEVAIACAVDPWLGGLLRGTELIPLDRIPGAVFTAQANGLRGVSVWLDRQDDEIELSLFEVADDGRTLGPERARARGVGTDEYGLTAFTFDPVTDSAGRRFAFLVSCPKCPGEQPRLIAGTAEDDAGNLIEAGRLRIDRVTAQTPIYDRVPPATSPSTRISLTGRSPGRWEVDVDAPNPALLVVAEAWFPGWRATVDGKSVPVVQADGAFLGVPLAAGQHVVTVEYDRPAAADIGRLITFGTLITIGVVAWWRRRRRDMDDEGPAPVEDSDWELATSDRLEADREATPPRNPPPAPPAAPAALPAAPADGEEEATDDGADSRPARRPRPGRPGRRRPRPDPPMSEPD